MSTNAKTILVALCVPGYNDVHMKFAMPQEGDIDTEILLTHDRRGYLIKPDGLRHRQDICSISPIGGNCVIRLYRNVRSFLSKRSLHYHDFLVHEDIPFVVELVRGHVATALPFRPAP